MPLAGGGGHGPTLLESLVPLLHASFHPVGVGVAAIVTLPGQVLVSFLLVLTAAGAFLARRRVDAAAAWVTVWALAFLVEIAFRRTLTRPPLYLHGVHLGFDASWPSGHALRFAIAAAALGAAWPRLRILLGIWLAAAVVLLELAGFHTTTDVVGGLLLATVAVTGAVEIQRSGLLGRGTALRGTRSRAGA